MDARFNSRVRAVHDPGNLFVRKALDAVQRKGHSLVGGKSVERLPEHLSSLVALEKGIRGFLFTG